MWYNANPTTDVSTSQQSDGVEFSDHDDKWTHVAVSRSGASLFIFLDGVLALEHTMAIGTSALGNAATPLFIGGYRGAHAHEGREARVLELAVHLFHHLARLVELRQHVGLAPPPAAELRREIANRITVYDKNLYF